jgi:sarcosine oxidase, subunit gamma
MADLRTERRAPLLATTPGVRPLPPAARWILRGGADARAAAAAALQLPIPDEACRAAAAGGRAALWLGPDEWLLIAPAADADAAGAALGAALAAVAHSLVDVSHRQVALELTTPQAALLIAAGCPLDLEPAAFPVGMCTRTMLGKAEIVLWRTGPDEFRIEVWRSFAPYVSAFLGEAVRGIA